MSEYIYETQGEQVIGNPKGFILPKEEIVRCRDCERYYEANEYHPQGNYDRRCCKYFDTYDDEVEPDGFCAWAVKRTGMRRMSGEGDV